MTDPRLSLLLHQLQLGYDLRSWHGPNLRGSLRGITGPAARWRPQPGRHNVQENVVHCAYWKYRVVKLLAPASVDGFTLDGSDWFPREGRGTTADWKQDVALLDKWHEALMEAAAAWDPKRLDERIRNQFTAAEVISGIAAHDLYHAGQIRLMRRMHEGKG